MKNKFNTNKIKDKKLLRKVKKNWVVISLSVFGAVSFGGIVNDNTVTHADVTVTSESTSNSSATSSDDSSAASSSDSSAASSGDDSSETSSSDSSAASSSDDSTATSSAASSATSSSDDSSEASSAASSATSSSTTSSSTVSSASSYATSSGKSYAYSVSVIDPNQTSDSYNANDGTNIQNINDFDYGITRGEADFKYLNDASNWVSNIDPMGAAWAPIINQYIKKGYYITFSQENIDNAETLFSNYVDKYGLSSNYSNYENSNYLGDTSHSISGLVKSPIVQDETGLKNVAQFTNGSQYDPTDNLQLSHIVVQINFGDGGDGGEYGQADNSDNQVYTNLQSLEPYAGHYEAPIYRIVMKDLTNSFGNYNQNNIDSSASDDDVRQASPAIPLDYLIFLHPQVYDKDGNLVVNDLSQAPIVTINYVYNGNQNVGSQKIFTDNESSIDENSLTVPDGYSLEDPNDSITISEGQDSVNVPVTKNGNSYDATSSAAIPSNTTSSTSVSSSATSSASSSNSMTSSASTSSSATSSNSSSNSTASSSSSATSSTSGSSSATSSVSTSSSTTAYTTIYSFTTSSASMSSSATSSTSTSNSATSSASSSSSTTSSTSTSNSATSSNSSSSSDNSYATDSSNETSSASSSSSDTSSTNDSNDESSSEASSSSDTSSTIKSSKATSSSYNNQPASKANSQATNKNKLPQTGENNMIKQLSLIGLILIAFSAFFGSLYKRNKK